MDLLNGVSSIFGGQKEESEGELERQVMQEYATKLRGLSKFDHTYEPEFVGHLIVHAKQHSSTLDELRDVLETEYELRKKRCDQESRLLSAYRDKFRRLKMWTAYDDEYIHTLLSHAKQHTTGLDELEEQLREELKAHVDKRKRMIKCDDFEQQLMNVYRDLRSMQMSSQESIAYVQMQTELRDRLKERPASLVGWIIEVIVKNESRGKLKASRVRYRCMEYDIETQLHKLDSEVGSKKQCEWVDLSQQGWALQKRWKKKKRSGGKKSRRKAVSGDEDCMPGEDLDGVQVRRI
jgi:hypothetical protein